MTVASTTREAPATAPSDDELLRRHRPYLLYDSQEDYRAASARTVVVNPGNRLMRGRDVIAGARGEGGKVLQLELLADGEERDHLAEAPWPVLAARRLQADPAHANRVYGRVVPGKRIWLQYWMWLYYNPKNLLGFGRHEGDWELVQIGLDRETLRPVAATYAQHGKGEGKDELAVEDWRRCEPGCAGECAHPPVYVAPFSHASYFEAGTHVYGPGIDNPDGAVFDGLPRLERLDDCVWRAWPGRWGAPNGLIGNGPPSPGRQKRGWDPDAFHERAKRRRPRKQRTMWRLGARTYPLEPVIELAELRGDTVVVGYRIRRTLWRRPRWLLVSVHDEGRIIRKRIVRVRGRARETRIPLRPGFTPALTVTASAYNLFRQRSDATEPAPVVPGAPPPLRDEWSRRTWQAFARALLDDVARHGPSTEDDLVRRRFHVLELALDDQELAAALESARDAGMIAPQGGSARRGATTAGLGATTVGPGATTVTPGTTTAGPGATTDADAVAWAPTASARGALRRLLARISRGADARAIAAEWSRHAVELPALNRWQRRRAWLGLLALAAAAGFVALVLVSPWFLLLAAPVAAVLALGRRELDLLVAEARAAREQGLG